MLDHDHHTNHHQGSGNERAIATAMVLTGLFMFAEVVGGLISGSLALLADAGHMLTDFASLALAWLAFRIGRRPPDTQRTFGFDRFSVLAAFTSGLSLFVIAGWICIQAVQRLREPVEVLGGLMLWVAIGGLLVNLASFWVLTRNETENLNVRAAALHVAGDLLGSVAAIVASVIIIFTGWMPIDPILSVFVALIILRSAWKVVRESGHILLEGAPRGFDQKKVVAAIQQEIPQVKRVSHMHVWCITQDRPMATMEIAIEPGADGDATKKRVKALLKDSFGLEHCTLEVEMLRPNGNRESRSTENNCDGASSWSETHRH